MVLLSVAIATYNGEAYLKEQLDSIYSQTRLPDEVVVVDDCSVDGTVEILQEYHKRYGLIYYVNERNLGFNQNFGKAIGLCSGQYIALCDQDDIWFPQKLERSLLRLQSVERRGIPTLVSSQCQDIDGKGNLLPKKFPRRDTSSMCDTLCGMRNSQGCCLMFNRNLVELILPIPPTDKIVTFDIYISLVAAMVGVKYNMAEPLMYYRHHQSNAIARLSNRSKSIKTKLKFNKYVLTYYPDFIPNERFALIEFVYRKFNRDIPQQRKNLIDRVLMLGDMSLPLYRRLNIIHTFSNLNCRKKWSMISKAIFAAIYKF